MENSKVKALFFAQYWGQKIFKVKPTAIACQTVDGYFLNGYTDTAHVLLRTVDQLTDEEFAVLSELDGYKPVAPHLGIKELIASGKIVSKRLSLVKIKPVIWQYLLRIGILLPFTYIDEKGKPQTLQPDEIIAKGWAKIKEEVCPDCSSGCICHHHNKSISEQS